MTIILYDVPSTIGVWAPNPWKARLVLNYKGFPYKTEWVEFPDVEETMKKLGAPPTGKKANGSASYTLPVIYDPKTSQYVAESFAIAEYLDATYPDTPPVVPRGSAAAAALFQHAFEQAMLASLGPLTITRVHAVLSPRGADYVRTTREAAYGCTLEELAPPGPVREEKWAKVKEGLTLMAGLYEKNGKDKLFFLGDTFSFADAVIVAFLVWPKAVLEPKEWEAIASWNDGRWAKLIEATAKYQGTP